MAVPQKMQNPTFRMKDIADYRFEGGLPTRENTNLDEPREMFLHMFVAMPGLNGAPMMLGTDYWMLVSEHMWELGAMLKCESCGHTKDPVKKYQAPTAATPNRWSSPGKWVPMDAPDQQPDVVDGMLSRMSHQQKVELYQALLADKDGHPLPDTPAAKVVQTMQLEAKAAVLSKLVEENNR